jgi:hypothetical protein
MRGPWRVAVAEGSMLLDAAPGDCPDLTVRAAADRQIREPGGGALAVKRVAAHPGDRAVRGRVPHLARRSRLLSDAPAAETEVAGFGPPIDSRRYGPCPLVPGRTSLVPLRPLFWIGRLR